MTLISPDQALLNSLRSKLREGRPVDALNLTRGYVPLDQWLEAGPDAAFYAIRLYSWLGNGSRSDAMAKLARKRYPNDANIFLVYYYFVARTRGAITAWAMLEDPAKLPVFDVPQQVFLATMRVGNYCNWSDFTTAFAILEEAERLRPGHDRTAMARARTLMKSDRREEAKEVVRGIIENHPGNVSAPKLLADLLQAEGKDDEALAALQTAVRDHQDFDLVLAVANWYSEHGKYSEALESASQFETLQPLADRSLIKWMAGWRAFRHYLMGNYPAALEQAQLNPDCFISEIADRLKSVTDGKRLQLEVPFVKQDRRTCAPATLAAICRYWGHQVAQVDIAEEICYDGTPDHSERNWAEENGYHTREFRVTDGTIRALIDRGIPFTLTTVEPASAHLQGVIGYDSTADTMLVREPGWSEHAEYRMSILDDYAFSGPRGMILIPREKMKLLDGVDLPEAELYDELHRLQRALHGNQREEAMKHFESLRAAHPEHRLTLVAARTIAQWDRNPHAQLEAYEGLLKLFPDQPALLYGKLWLLQSTAGRREQIDFAKKLIATGKAPTEVRRELADLLDDDARDWQEAESAWHRAAKFRPYDGATMTGLANFRWNQLRRHESTRFYRLASCAEILNESSAQTYFNAARWLGAEERETALNFLRMRVVQYGARSGHPARTLAWALERLNRQAEALDVLEEALKLRPEDGPLILHAADTFRFVGNQARADALIASAQQHLRPADWLRRAAQDAIRRADLEAAISCFRNVLQQEPTNRDIHGQLANLLAGTAGQEAAVQHLEAVCSKFPGNASLHALLSEWLSEQPERRIEVLLHMLQLDPGDAWARRELALLYKHQRQFDESIASAQEALAVEPWSAFSHGILGDALHAAGKHESAVASLRQSLEMDVDYDWAISELIRVHPTIHERKELLQWIFSELEKQYTNGEGLRRWQQEAWPVLEPSEVLEKLEQARGARPDLWQTWSVLGLHLRDMGRLDESLSIATEATERFPFLPRIWLDLAIAQSRQGDLGGEKAALEQALALNPTWLVTVRRMASVCQTLDQPDDARKLLEAHTRTSPLDHDVWLDLIRLLRRLGEHEAARVAAERAVTLSRLESTGWLELAKSVKGKDDLEATVLDEAKELTDRMPKNAKAWECRAYVAGELRDYAEELKVIDEALTHLPHDWDFLDRKALLLAEYGKYPAALQCCETEGVAKAFHHFRQARRADILYRQGMQEEAIQEMETLLKEHPDYPWGLARLVEWHDHRADHEAVLKWSQLQSRISPTSAIAWGYQADAYLKLNRKDEAELALRKAICLDAGYTWAARQLLQLEINRGDLEAADRTVARVRGRVPISTLALVYKDHGQSEKAADLCRSAVAMDASDYRNHNSLGEALWEMGEQRIAVDHFLDAAKLDPRNHDLAEKLSERVRTVQCEAEIFRLLAAWVEEAPEEVGRHTLRCRFHRFSKDTEGHLRALDDAIARATEIENFVDLKIVQLTESRRIKEAFETCARYDSEEKPNAMTRRRKAWLQEQIGLRKEAIDTMKAALELDRTSVFGLQKICDWLEEESRPEEAVAFAEHLIEVNPTDAGSFGFLASALMKASREKEAEPFLKRAFRMWTEYAWAADNLFRLQLKRGGFADAAITLRMVREHLPGASTVLKELQLTAAQKKFEDTMAAWQRLTREATLEGWHLRAADQAIADAGWAALLDQAWKVRSKQDPSALVLRHWMERSCEAGANKSWRGLMAMNLPEVTQIGAWCVFLDAAGRNGDPNGNFTAQAWFREGLRAIRKNKKLFKQNTRIWGQVGWFYTKHKCYRKGRNWVSNWRDHRKMEGWMSANTADLIDGPWYNSRSEEFRRWSLANLPADHGFSYHRAQLALLYASRRRVKEAQALLDDINDNDLGDVSVQDGMRFYIKMAELLIALQKESVPISARRNAAAKSLLSAIKEAGGAAKIPRQPTRIMFKAGLNLGGFSKFTLHLLRFVGVLIEA